MLPVISRVLTATVVVIIATGCDDASRESRSDDASSPQGDAHVDADVGSNPTPDPDRDADVIDRSDGDGELESDADGESTGDSGEGDSALLDSGIEDASWDGDLDGGALSDAGSDSESDTVPDGWVAVAAATFTMGSPASDFIAGPSEAPHEVTLTRGFFMLETEVTQGQFESLMGYSPSSASFCGDECPVESVTWHEAALYCNELSAVEALDSCYECSGSGHATRCTITSSVSSPYECSGYRLPTEAEWELAARGGTESATPGGDLDDYVCSSTILDPIAWYCGNSSYRSHEVRGREPNALGLYDMLGNVREWCHDGWRFRVATDETDPSGDGPGALRVVRGGDYSTLAQGARSASREGYLPILRNGTTGFRPVRSAD